MGNDLENDLANLLFGNDSEDDAIIVSDSPVKSIPLKSTSIIISDSPVKQPLATCTSANLFIPRKIQPKAQVMRQPTISSFIPPHQSSNKPKPVFNPHAQFNKQIQYVNLKTNSPHYVASPSKTTILSANISSTTNLNIVKLLEDISSQNDPQIEHPKIKCTLLPYQLTGVSWLVARETGIHRGAILADDMGLGKTIQTIALIANSSSSTTSTLIVAPLALITQWESEIKTKSSLRVYLHHGPSRSTEENYLKRFDVVVTTYSIVASESKVDGVLFKIKWHRIVLDEAQTIKNRNTASSLACCKLSSKYKLALSGTPIQNSIDDLYSLIKFLKINVFENYNNWKEKISTPLNNKRENGDAMERLRVLLKAIMLRRTKSTIIDGKHILELPNRNVEISKLKFSDQERKFYDSLEDKMKNRAKSVIKEAGKNQFILLTMLLRLRQACSHPHLVGFENTRDVEEGLDGLDSLMGSMNINQSCKICGKRCV